MDIRTLARTDALAAAQRKLAEARRDLATAEAGLAAATDRNAWIYRQAIRAADVNIAAEAALIAKLTD